MVDEKKKTDAYVLHLTSVLRHWSLWRMETPFVAVH
jgi:hypothetical protein